MSSYYNSIMRRDKVITIRVNGEMYAFLSLLAQKSKTTISEIVRSIVMYFFFAYSLNKLKVPMSELTREFYEKYVKKSKNAKSRKSKTR